MMNESLSIIVRAQNNGVILAIEDDALVLKLETDHIDDDLLADIKSNKELILDCLRKMDVENGAQEASSKEEIKPFDRESIERIPLSFNQERLWFLDELQGTTEYHLPFALRLSGHLDKEILFKSLKEIVARHEVLRTVIYSEEGTGYQKVLSADNWELSFKDMSAETSKVTEDLKLFLSIPFDLSSDYMFRSQLYDLGNNEYILAGVFHHIASDAWSQNILIGDFIALYHTYTSGKETNLPSLSLQYTDYALWQREHFEKEGIENQLSYWEKQLKDVGTLQLPMDYARPTEQSITGASLSFELDSHLSKEINALSQQEGVTVFMTLLTAFKVLLSRYSGQNDICVGTSVANRTQKELEEMIGFFVNNLPLHTQIKKESSFKELLQSVKQTTLDAYEYQDVPFGEIVSRVVTTRETGMNPLFQTLFVLQNAPKDNNVEIEGLTISSYEDRVPETSNFDLKMTISEQDVGFSVGLNYRTDLFKEETIERMFMYYQELLKSIVASPSSQVHKMSMLPQEEKYQLLDAFGHSSVSYKTEKTIIDLFEAQVAETPEAIALDYKGERITYKELNEKSNQLAHYLMGKGVSPEQLVGICLDRSLEMIIGVLGILKSGGAYVPIDPNFPQPRKEYMLKDSAVKILLSDGNNSSSFSSKETLDVIELDNHWDSINKESKNNLQRIPSPEDVVYVIYTSGSTGQPKGVQITHSSLTDYFYGLLEKTNIASCNSFVSTSSIAADLGNTILFPSLLTGGSLHILSEDELINADKISALNIDCLKMVPSHWKSLRTQDKILTPNKCLILGGEAFTNDVFHLLAENKANCEVYNHYGPTETTIGKLIHKVDLTQSLEQYIPLGVPFGNTNVYIINSGDQLCPIGVAGELCIGGEGVAKGYLNNEELTKEKFIDNLFKEGDHIYKTGDLAKWRSDGTIEFLGRKDNQIKIRGYRIELGEIENALAGVSGIHQSCVLAQPDEHGDLRLIGYVVTETELDKESLQEELEKSLPEYMVPRLWVTLDEMPLTSNGKIDRKALPEIDSSTLSTKAYVAPRTEIEERLTVIWQELLKVDKVGIYDNFFELGGQSLLTIRLVAKIRKLGYTLSIGDFYADPSIASLSTKLVATEKEYKVPENGIKRGCEYITPAMVTLVDLNQKELDIIMDHVPGGAKNIQDIYPLAPLQEGIYFHHLMADKTQGDPYSLSRLLSYNSAEKRSEFLAALDFVINRHDVLRTCVLNDGLSTAVQIVLREAKLNIEQIAVGIEKDILSQVQEQQAARNLYIDLTQAPTIHVKIADDPKNGAYYLLLENHHMMMDHLGTSKIIEEINLYLSGRAGFLSKPSLYRDFVGQTLNKEKRAESESYFRRLYGHIETPSYPFNLSDTKISGATKMLVSRAMLPETLRDEIRKISNDLQMSPAILFHAAFGLVVGQYSGTNYALFGSVFLGRLQGAKGSESSLGLFMNTLPILLDLSGDIRSYITQTDENLKKLLDHEQTPLSSIHDVSGIPNDVPLFSSLLNYRHSVRSDPKDTENAEVKMLSGHARTNYPFSVDVDDFGDDFALTFNIASIGIDPLDLISYMEEALKALLENIDSSSQVTVDQLSILTKEETHKLLEVFNDTDTVFRANTTVIDLFEEQVLKTPDILAVIHKGASLTYQELHEKSNQLAHHLIQKGISAEDKVAICLDRNINMIMGILGILKSGAAYVPIDPEYPTSRKDYMLEDSGVSILLTDSETILAQRENVEAILLDSDWEAINKASKDDIDSIASPENPVYILYTSGSTGKPKGVSMPHKGMFNLICAYYEMGIKCERVAQFNSMSFDASFLEVFFTLTQGGILYMVPSRLKGDLKGYAEFMNENVIKTTFLPTSFFHFIGGENVIAQLPIVTDFVVAGEQLKLPKIAIEGLKKIGATLHNHYGPTEAHVVTIKEVDYEDENVGDQLSDIGKPVPNTQIHILNHNLELVPTGSVGELCIGGDQVARGYINKEDLTNQKFVPNPFKEGEKMYRTGDLARWLPNGNVEFLGRKDDQIKVRGYRIELGEIENILSQLPGVTQSCVLAKRDSEGNNRLVGYAVTEGVFDKEFLQAQLEEKLPEYMVPRLWIEMDEMPLTSNGKLDRRALPELDSSELSSKVYAAPRNEMEQQLATIWEELLKLDKVGIHDTFFELGGHSLLATRLVSMIRKELSVEVSIRDVFTHTTIDTLATYLLEQDKGTLLPKVVKVENKPNKIPLSFSQERLWFLDKFQGSAEYHIPFALRFSGELDKEALSASLKEIITRHEILRTVINSEEGTPYQEILSSKEWELFLKETTHTTKEIQEFISTPFDLSSDYMFRAGLFKDGASEYILVAVFHHIASDGWSQNILINEFVELYRAYASGTTANLPELPIQYADHALWQREHLEGEVIENELSYWETQLYNADVLQLPTDYPRSAKQSVSGADIFFQIDNELSSELNALSQREGVTVFMTLLTAFKVLMSRYSGQPDISVGTPVANRTQKELEGVIGFFVNTLSLRSQTHAEDSFSELLQAVKQTTLDAYDHQQVPFEKVVERVVKTRDTGTTPLFQVMFVLQNTPQDTKTTIDGLTLSNYEGEGTTTSKFDITITLFETEAGFSVNMNYCTDMFKKETIQRMLVHYRELLTSIVMSPSSQVGDLSMLTSEEKHQLVDLFNDTNTEYPEEKSVVDLFQEQTSKTPDAIAVTFEAEYITYQELDEKSNQLAHYLIDKGISVEDTVGICMNRSLEIMIGILGTLKSGAAYVPIDAEYPQSRVDYMLEDAAVKIVLSDGFSTFESNDHLEVIRLESDWDKINQASKERVLRKVSPENLAYIIYTSGSTGRPKGVQVEHKNIVSLATSCDYVDLNDETVWLSTGSISFDAITIEYWGTLLNGGKLILTTTDKLLSTPQLKRLIGEHKVNTLWMTASWFHQIVEEDLSVFKFLDYLLVGGDAVLFNYTNKVKEAYPEITLINGYGPTENTTFSTTYTIDITKGALPIGKPIKNSTAYVTDQDMNLLPVGVVGELLVGGSGVARGYLNDDELTKERFIANPFKEGNRLYKTGDLVKRLPDGNIEFIGRKDDQVKIRGYRIELGEIENVLSQVPQVTQSCVLTKEDEQGNKRLIGYVVMENDFDKESLQLQLKKNLPEYMVPRLWIALDEMPLTSNGKLDRKALPEPDGSSLSTKEYVTPRTETEEKLVAIWQELLGIGKVGIYDNFFELGGHSLLAVRLIIIIQKELDIEVSIQDVFEFNCIEELGNYIQYLTLEEGDFEEEILL